MLEGVVANSGGEEGGPTVGERGGRAVLERGVVANRAGEGVAHRGGEGGGANRGERGGSPTVVWEVGHFPLSFTVGHHPPFQHGWRSGWHARKSRELNESQ